MDKDLEFLIKKCAIEELRYKYWYSILDKDADSLLELFTDDVSLDYGFGVVMNGKQEARGFFAKLMTNEAVLRQVPRGANGIVEFTGADRGKGRWMVEAVTIIKGVEEATLGSAQYFEEYVKVDGNWKICRMKTDYLYFEKIRVSETIATNIGDKLK